MNKNKKKESSESDHNPENEQLLDNQDSFAAPLADINQRLSRVLASNASNFEVDIESIQSKLSKEATLLIEYGDDFHFVLALYCLLSGKKPHILTEEELENLFNISTLIEEINGENEIYNLIKGQVIYRNTLETKADIQNQKILDQGAQFLSSEKEKPEKYRKKLESSYLRVSILFNPELQSQLKKILKYLFFQSDREKYDIINQISDNYTKSLLIRLLFSKDPQFALATIDKLRPTQVESIFNSDNEEVINELLDCYNRDSALIKQGLEHDEPSKDTQSIFWRIPRSIASELLPNDNEKSLSEIIDFQMPLDEDSLREILPGFIKDHKGYLDAILKIKPIIDQFAKYQDELEFNASVPSELKASSVSVEGIKNHYRDIDRIQNLIILIDADYEFGFEPQEYLNVNQEKLRRYCKFLQSRINAEYQRLHSGFESLELSRALNSKIEESVLDIETAFSKSEQEVIKTAQSRVEDKDFYKTKGVHTGSNPKNNEKIQLVIEDAARNEREIVALRESAQEKLFANLNNQYQTALAADKAETVLPENDLVELKTTLKNIFIYLFKLPKREKEIIADTIQDENLRLYFCIAVGLVEGDKKLKQAEMSFDKFFIFFAIDRGQRQKIIASYFKHSDLPESEGSVKDAKKRLKLIMNKGENIFNRSANYSIGDFQSPEELEAFLDNYVMPSDREVVSRAWKVASGHTDYRGTDYYDLLEIAHLESLYQEQRAIFPDQNTEYQAISHEKLYQRKVIVAEKALEDIRRFQELTKEIATMRNEISLDSSPQDIKKMAELLSQLKSISYNLQHFGHKIIASGSINFNQDPKNGATKADLSILNQGGLVGSGFLIEFDLLALLAGDHHGIVVTDQDAQPLGFHNLREMVDLLSSTCKIPVGMNIKEPQRVSFYITNSDGSRYYPSFTFIKKIDNIVDFFIKYPAIYSGADLFIEIPGLNNTIKQTLS
jgi:hypothetical protein